VEGHQRDSFESDKIQVGYAGKSGTPYWQWEKKEKMLEGDALKRQLDVWVKYGTIEKDAAEAVKLCVDQPDKYCNLKEHTFVILGATSAMGPIDVSIFFFGGAGGGSFNKKK
jgi:hypothetical protein